MTETKEILGILSSDFGVEPGYSNKAQLNELWNKVPTLVRHFAFDSRIDFLCLLFLLFANFSLFSV